MKKIIAQTATAVCIVFTVMMAWFLAMGYLFAGPSYGLNLTASLYGAAFGMAALQAIWFTGALIKKLPYPARIAGFGACLLPEPLNASVGGMLEILAQTLLFSIAAAWWVKRPARRNPRS